MNRSKRLDETWALRSQKPPALTDVEVIQAVKASHHPRRQMLRGIEAEMAAELARERPPEPRRRVEAAPRAGVGRLDWRRFGLMVAEGERAAEVAAQVQADLAKARPWMPSKEHLAVLRSQLAMAQEVAGRPGYK